jgi:hypothetical protein
MAVFLREIGEGNVFVHVVVIVKYVYIHGSNVKNACLIE